MAPSRFSGVCAPHSCVNQCRLVINHDSCPATTANRKEVKIISVPLCATTIRLVYIIVTLAQCRLSDFKVTVYLLVQMSQILARAGEIIILCVVGFVSWVVGWT